MTRQRLVPSSCVNHPERPSTMRCRRCNLPICKKCAVVTPHGVYCSETCAEQMAKFLEKAAALEQPLGPPRTRWLRKIARLAVLVVLVVAGWYLVETGWVAWAWSWVMSLVRTVRGG